MQLQMFELVTRSSSDIGISLCAQGLAKPLGTIINMEIYKAIYLH